MIIYPDGLIHKNMVNLIADLVIDIRGHYPPVIKHGVLENSPLVDDVPISKTCI